MAIAAAQIVSAGGGILIFWLFDKRNIADLKDSVG